LLSEAERGYAARRAGTTTPFWWGASISTSQANYNGTYTYGSGSKGENRQKTVLVDTFQPNAWGAGWLPHVRICAWGFPGVFGASLGVAIVDKSRNIDRA
jgi:hypothetical protein